MASHILELFRHYLAAYGYWAVAATLLLENAGLPLPGETILLLASFAAYSEHRLRLPYIILTGVCAATLGDNIGFLIGHYGGRPLLWRYSRFFHLKPETLAKGEKLMQRHGSVTIFTARFIAGLRVFAGPLAGVLRMHWKKFVIFNFLGAALWVTVIASAGYLFGRHWESLLGVIRDTNVVIIIAAVCLIGFFWWKHRQSSKSAR